jgi:3'-5' exoribonuclease
VGRLHGEIVTGQTIVATLIRDEVELPPETSTRLLHIIVSHHGEREKGSPAVPMTKEAVVVHFCDDMTARLAAFDQAQRATPAGERWTGYCKMLETSLFLGGGVEAPCAEGLPPEPQGRTADGDDTAADTEADSEGAGTASAGDDARPAASPSLFD